MNLTERDICVVDFINIYKAATTKMLIDLYYTNYNVGTRRLKMLVDEGYLKRSRIATGEWLYHSDNGIYLKNLMITKFALALMSKGIDVSEVYYNKDVEGINVDAQIVIKYKNSKYMLLVDSEILGSFNKVKYDKLFNEKDTIKGYMPIVVAIDNKPIDTEASYKIVRLNRDISNIEDLLKKLGS